MNGDLKHSLVRIAGLARHTAARQQVLAENMANADVPGYAARDLPAFASLVARGDPTDFVPRATLAAHFGDAPAVAATPERAAVSAAPNGNSVSLEEQTMLAAENAGQHRLAVSLYAKAADLLRLGLGRQR